MDPTDDKKTTKINWLPIMIKAERLSAWTLLVVAIAFGVTGYGMTKGLIPVNLARTLHFGWLQAIGLAAFVIHTSWGVHLSLRRHKLWNRYSKIGLVAFYVGLILYFGWVRFFYQAHGSEHRSKAVSNITAAAAAGATETFNAETLKAFDGRNGQPAYVAVDGVVYDMSRVFIDGMHHGFAAGQDQSAAFHGKHPESYLKNLPVVGTYGSK